MELSVVPVGRVMRPVTPVSGSALLSLAVVDCGLDWVVAVKPVGAVKRTRYWPAVALSAKFGKV